MTSLKKICENEKLLAVIIFCVTFLIRLPFLIKLQTDPAFLLPIIDCKEFNFWAFQILNINHGLWVDLNNHPVLYAYFLVIVYKIFGHSLVAVILLQYVMGSLCTAMIYLITRRLLGLCAGLAASILMAGYWFFIYTQSFIYSENLSMVLNVLLIYILLFMKDTLVKYMIGGFLLGFSILCRPDIALFGVFILFWFMVKQIKLKRMIAVYTTFLLVMLMVVLPVMIRNYKIAGEFLLRTQIGANFYMGNIPEFQGSNIFVERGKIWNEFISMPYRELNPTRMLNESEINQYFITKTIKRIWEDPLSWFKLMIFKAFSIFTGREFLRSEDVYFYDGYIKFTPLGFIGTQLIFLLAIPGLYLSFREEPKRFALIYIFLFSGMFILFFAYKTRYLVPLMPFFMIFSANTIAFIYKNFIEKKYFSLISMGSFLTFFYLLSFFNLLHLNRPTAAEAYYEIAQNFQWYGLPKDALQSFQKSLQFNPRNDSALNDLGYLYLTLGQYEKALIFFKKALEIDPDQPAAKYNYSRTQKMLATNQSEPYPMVFPAQLLEQIRLYHSFFTLKNYHL